MWHSCSPALNLGGVSAQRVEMPLGMGEPAQGMNPCPYILMVSVMLSSSSWLPGEKEKASNVTALSSAR